MSQRCFSSRDVFRSRKTIAGFVGGTLVLLSIAALLLTTIVVRPHSTHAAPLGPTDQLPKVGNNVSPPTAAQDRMFADAMKSGRPTWDHNDHLGDGTAPVDAQGWPTTDASNIVWEGVGNNDGTYQLIFNGQATVSTSFNYGTVSNQQYNAATNTTTATIVITDTNPENFSLIFSNTQRTPSSGTNTGVTNVKLMRPLYEGASTSYDPSVTFTDQYKAAQAPYAVLRFMAGTNFNTSVNWSDRTRPFDFNQRKVLAGESGFEGNNIAYEYMIQLCNETNKDCYINIPHKATNDYITKLAQLIKYGSDGVNPYTSPQSNPVFAPLNSNLNVYLEYSNETWNWAFQQAHDIYDMANAEVNAGGSNLNYDGETNTYALGWRYPARQTVVVSDLFRAVFGDSAMITRVRPVLEFQYADYNSTASLGLDFINNYYNNGDGGNHVANPHPVNYYLWGAGGAVYYDSGNDAAGSVDGIYASGFPYFGGQNIYQSVLNTEGQWAHAYGLHYIAYEGGMAVGGDGANAVQRQAFTDPRAKQTMIDSFNDFTAAGGDIYIAGTYQQWNTITSAPTDPLVQAAATINSSSFVPAPVALGTAVAGSGTTTISAGSYDVTSAYYEGTVDQTNNVGAVAGYLTRVSTPGTYQIALNVGNTAAGGLINVYSDGNLLATVQVPNTGSMSTHQLVVAGSVSWSTGLHSVLLRSAGGPAGGKSGDLDSIQITFGQAGGNPTPTPTLGNTATPTPTSTPVNTPTPTPTPITGGNVLTGSNINDGGGPWGGNQSNTADKAFDGDINTFYDAATATGAWTGIDLGSGKSATVSSIRYYPRSYFSDRMVGGIFQVSNDLSNWTNLATISSAPTEQQWSTTTVTDTGSYRYLRYLSAGTNSYGNVAEIQFIGSTSGGGSTPTPTPTPGTTPTPTPTPVPPTPTPTSTPVASGSLLANDPFNGNTGAINGVSTGSGWGGSWTEQLGDTSVPGYDIASGSPLSYSTLATSGNYAIGGLSYQTLGRNLNVSNSGPFSSYLNGNGLIGQSGSTLWVSFLLRKDADTDQENSVSLHDRSIPWYSGGATSLIGAGYFGSASNTGGNRYWSLKIGNTVYQSGTPVTVGQTTLLVLRIDFGSTTTASLYANPGSLGGNAPATASVQGTSTAITGIQSLAYYGGDGTNQSSLDEIRFGTSYAAVTPTH